MANIVDFVQTMMRGRNLSPMLVNDAPVLVRQAVIDLQNSNLLPPRQVKYNSDSVINIEYNIKEEVEYKYIKLPEDLREIDELTVDGKHYIYDDNWHYFATRFIIDRAERYTILDVDDDKDQEPRSRLIIYPYPENKQIELRYYTDGSDVALRRIDEKYYTAILSKIYSFLNIVSKNEAQEEINDIVGQTHNKQGVNGYNKTPQKLKSFYFGK